MADRTRREPVLWSLAVLGLAATFLLVGMLTPAGPDTAARSHASGHDARADARALVAPKPLDPQPDTVVRYTTFRLRPPLDAPGVAGVLERLGGADPDLSGLVSADQSPDAEPLPDAIGALPGAQPQGVMTVVVRGGESAAFGVERTTTDPRTGVVTGRRQVTASTTATVLEGDRIALTVSLRDEHDTTALAVLGREAGIDLGRTSEARGTLILLPDQPAAIRLPGRDLTIVLLSIEVRRPPADEP